jgi:hypothetical protein
MGNDVKDNCSNEIESVRAENSIVEVTESILLDTQVDIHNKNTLSVPITELTTLGAGVSSLIPELRTITQTTEIGTQGLYRVANAGIGDVLKTAKDGTKWGALKRADGSSALGKFVEADSLSVTTNATMPVNPTTMMMAVSLFSIEQQLNTITEQGKQILSFLETEKESEIEADVETLINIINNYKLNWDNEHFVTSNHKMVLDIQRTARKNMNIYQKKVSENLNSKQWLVIQNQVEALLNNLEKEFKYYKLSLYTYSLASFLEVMLSGNFKEEYISETKEEIRTLSQTYRNLFGLCSIQLEKVSNSSIETNVIKGIGSVGKTVGKFIGSIPVVKEGKVDEFLEDRGSNLKKIASDKERVVVKEFASISNPDTGVFVEKLEDMIKIYNHTSEIYFDEEKIYLITD